MAFNKEAADTSLKAFGWNDEIADDGKAFEKEELVVLPEGIYDFEVVKFDKGFQNATPKIPNGCNKAQLLLKIKDKDGKTNLVNENLLLINSMEWKLSAFFRAIGQKKHGEKISMGEAWSQVKGAKGKAKFKVGEYQTKDGTMKKKNEVDSYLDYVADVGTKEEPWY